MYYFNIYPYMNHFNNNANYGMDFNHLSNKNLLNHYPTSLPTGTISSNTLNRVRTGFTKKEAEAIALLLGIDFTKYKFDLDEFWMGVNVELEHGKQFSQTNVTGDDPLLTGKIAWAHLNEFPDYYKRLKILEEEAKAHWNK